MAHSARLQTEWQRLFGLDGRTPTHLEARSQVRFGVIEVRQPLGWDQLSPLWEAVQTELSWPAPAIAVSGDLGHQLWFAWLPPLTCEQASALLSSLCQRYLAHADAQHICLWPRRSSDGTWAHVPHLPPQAVHPDQWAAFLARDLAPVFNETPWLDLPPNPDGQADLLARLKPIDAMLLQSAQTHADQAAMPNAVVSGAKAETDPAQFLMHVMNDPQMDMHLRIEAAKALLTRGA